MTDPIKKFFRRLEQAGGRTQEIRLSLDEARQLGNAISILMAKKIESYEASEREEKIISGGSL